MQVAVVTPYFREPRNILQDCHNSVVGQTYPCTHILVADGFPRPEISDWRAQHITLAKPHADVGNTPRAIGSLSAMNLDFDAIAYLDADNWLYPNHIELMVRLHEQTSAAVCTASRSIHRTDGSRMFFDTESDGKNHVDTSCFFFTRRAFRVLTIWAMMPRQLGPIGDRVMWGSIQSHGLPCAHSNEPTVAFRTQYAAHYRFAGETPPPLAKTNEDSTVKAWRWWTNLPAEERTAWLSQMGLKSR